MNNDDFMGIDDRRLSVSIYGKEISEQDHPNQNE